MRILLLIVAAFALLAPPPAAAQGEKLRVMSFNVRVPVASDGANAWPKRRTILIETIRREAPDLIGTQELHKIQGDAIVTALPGYGWFGIDRRGGQADEYMGIFYRRDRLDLVELGNFWLSDTPSAPGSISWGNIYPRMVTWGLFQRRSDHRRFYLLNTHFPYRDEDEAARSKAAAAIAAFIATLPVDVPVVLTGDFNTTPDSEAHKRLAATLGDTRDAAPGARGPAETFHGFSGKPDKRIDWILARGARTLGAATTTFNRAGRYPSDHFPIVADLAFD